METAIEKLLGYTALILGIALIVLAIIQYQVYVQMTKRFFVYFKFLNQEKQPCLRLLSVCLLHVFQELIFFARHLLVASYYFVSAQCFWPFLINGGHHQKSLETKSQIKVNKFTAYQQKLGLNCKIIRLLKTSLLKLVVLPANQQYA